MDTASADVAFSAETKERIPVADVHMGIGLAVDSEINQVKYEHHHHGEAIDWSPVDFDETLHSDLFEPPQGFEAARHKIHSGQTSVMVLSVPEGGRSTSALAILKGCESLVPRRIGPRSRPFVTSKHLALYPSSAWLMDLTDCDEEFEWDKLLEQLAGLAQDVGRQESVLIVVADQDEVSSPETRKYGIVQDLGRPDAYGVFERKLSSAFAGEKHKTTYDTSEGDKAEADSQAVSNASEFADDTVEKWTKFFRDRGHLDGEPPGVALRLANAVLDARSYWESLKPPDKEALKDKFVESRRATAATKHAAIMQLLALDRFQTWETELDHWNAQHQTESSLKTFQVAAALLPSGDPIRVREAGTKLHGMIEGDTEDPGLRGPGTRLLVSMSMAELKNGRISFPRPGFREAVVRYFWEDWPGFREEFLAWMMELAEGTETSEADRSRVKERIADFAIHHAQQRGEFEFLNEVITTWADSGFMTDAVKLLERAATTSGIFSKVRTNSLQWLSQANTARKRVVAELCSSETFAPDHPRLVMTRLSHLMNADVPRDTLAKSFRLLVAANGHTERVLEWLKAHASGDGSNRERAGQLFLELAAVTLDRESIPVLLKESKASETTRSNLVSCWAGVFRNVAVDDASETFHKWMECCSQPALADEVLTMFYDALIHTRVENYKAAQSVDKLARDWSKASSLTGETRIAIDGRLATMTREIRASIDENPVFSAARVDHE